VIAGSNPAGPITETPVGVDRDVSDWLVIAADDRCAVGPLLLPQVEGTPLLAPTGRVAESRVAMARAVALSMWCMVRPWIGER
jgi:hypothetical protein